MFLVGGAPFRLGAGRFQPGGDMLLVGGQRVSVRWGMFQAGGTAYRPGADTHRVWGEKGQQVAVPNQVAVTESSDFARKLAVAGCQWVERECVPGLHAAKVAQVYQVLLKVESEGCAGACGHSS